MRFVRNGAILTSLGLRYHSSVGWSLERWEPIVGVVAFHRHQTPLQLYPWLEAISDRFFPVE